MLEINRAFTQGTDATDALRFASPASRFTGGSAGSSVGTRGDAVQPNWWNGLGSSAATPSAGGGLIGMLEQIVAAFGSALQNGAQQALGAFGGTRPTAPATTLFTNATLGSVGDPHLSLSGTTAASATPIDAHFDSMTSHDDLFSTPSFGGFGVSTTAGAPNASGVTTNASATAFLDRGADTITMDADGSLAVTSGGRAIDVADGTSVTLDGGATLSRASNGAVTIADTTPSGRSLSTTFAANGSGVDVSATAQNVALGGDLIATALRS
jgi:hypothetical protein